jgi:hypothetical protein
MYLFGGYDRARRHFISDKYHRARGGGFLNKEDIEDETQGTGNLELVVLMFRDPIARVVSECFHKVDEGDLAPRPKGTDLAAWVLAVGDHSAMIDHLVYEVPNLGLDILSVPFEPPVMRYATAPLMLGCRLKDIDALPKALGENGFPMFGRKVLEANFGSYPKLRFPKHYVDRMMENVYTEHFYSKKEIVGMRKKWTDG